MKIIIILLLLFLLCEKGKTTKIDIKLYAGDSGKVGITRAQDNETILCSDSKLDDFICMTYEDHTKIHETYRKYCSIWKESADRYIKMIKNCRQLQKEDIDKFMSCFD